jgi:hypothetical protein
MPHQQEVLNSKRLQNKRPARLFATDRSLAFHITKHTKLSLHVFALNVRRNSNWTGCNLDLSRAQLYIPKQWSLSKQLNLGKLSTGRQEGL